MEQKKLSIDIQHNCTIGSHHEPVNIDDIMYRFYVLEKIRKGREAVETGNSITIAALQKEMGKWGF